MNKAADMTYKCLDCGDEVLVKGNYKTMDGRLCSKCKGHVVPNRYADTTEPKKKAISSIKIGIELEGYEKIKGQLRNIEATFDRILEKQEKVSKNSSCMSGIGGNGLGTISKKLKPMKAMIAGKLMNVDVEVGNEGMAAVRIVADDYWVENHVHVMGMIKHGR